jgi:quaternary ammonium compound-resistance protein SugE
VAWVLLSVAGLFEIGWALGLKFIDGFARPLPLLGTGVSMVASVVLLGIAVKTLPVGTAYAVWTGIGAVGTVILGIVLFHEPASPIRLFCLALILCGILGLKLSSGS